MAGQSRRKFLGEIILGFSGLALLVEPAISFWAKAWGKLKKRVLSPETSRDSLISEDPKGLDAHNLEITPLKEFGTMGEADYKADLNHWALKVEGLVMNPLRLSYTQIKALPFIERKVLLICPGFFANQGLWKGISIRALLEKAKAKPEATHIIIKGPKDSLLKQERFPIKDVLEDKVFLAYQVNGSDLPQKHGFPLRAVAEDYYGSVWVKFVETIKVEKG